MRSTASYWPRTLDAANEDTLMIFTRDFRNAVWTITAESNANATIKFYASNQETRPNLDNAASLTNRYAVTEVVSLDTGDGIDWSTWVTFNGSQDWTYMYEINQNANTWLGVVMTARSAGTVTLYLDLADNQ